MFVTILISTVTIISTNDILKGNTNVIPNNRIIQLNNNINIVADKDAATPKTNKLIITVTVTASTGAQIEATF